ncbi:MAG: hypothetical protein CME70_03170 [Halobacteriovorax sp.]|nr:hypothetical protein [Halobacteriovorax sp.]MBK22984.1 hypothetical protein [Halobacteriovorax sp.]|tara:strand:+ start:13300 stop:13548 length:249 start_codon:yes stop_codon:yes gene_type:complete
MNHKHIGIFIYFCLLWINTLEGANHREKEEELAALRWASEVSKLHKMPEEKTRDLKLKETLVPSKINTTELDEVVKLDLNDE